LIAYLAARLRDHRAVLLLDVEQYLGMQSQLRAVRAFGLADPFSWN